HQKSLDTTRTTDMKRFIYVSSVGLALNCAGETPGGGGDSSLAHATGGAGMLGNVGDLGGAKTSMVAPRSSASGGNSHQIGGEAGRGQPEPKPAAGAPSTDPTSMAGAAGATNESETCWLERLGYGNHCLESADQPPMYTFDSQ